MKIKNKKGYSLDDMLIVIIDVLLIMFAVLVVLVVEALLYGELTKGSKNQDIYVQKIIDVANDIKVIKAQYVHKDEKKYDIKKVKLSEVNEKYDGYFVDIDKKYMVVKNNEGEFVLLGIKNKIDQIKNEKEKERVENELCQRMFGFLIDNKTVLGVAKKDDINEKNILTSGKDYCKKLNYEDELYLILESKLY